MVLHPRGLHRRRIHPVDIENQRLPLGEQRQSQKRKKSKKELHGP
jgi:hypothetical protein